MAPVIRQLDPSKEAAWDEYVARLPEGTFFHRAGWRYVIERAFGHSTHYVFAEQDGAITGVLPLVHIRSLWFGSRLVSVPFCVYGGPLASESKSAQALATHSIDLMNRLGADLVEFRMREPSLVNWAARSNLYATFRKPISSDAEENLKAIPRKQRAMVRKAIENGLRSRSDQNTERFYRIYAESVRNLGTPVFSRGYLRLLVERFRDCSEILTVLDDGEPIAAVLSFFFRDEILPYYGGGVQRARQRAANDFMYWEVMKGAAGRDVRLFDFGRSKLGTGSFAFKKNWGFVPQPLHYQFWLRPGRPIPDHNPLNPKYRVLIGAWKRLPLPFANLIGPRIVRGIG
jgi:FemAB-related protein (PEP-CTERM system-associated)